VIKELGHDGTNPDDPDLPLGVTEAEAVLLLHKRGRRPLWVRRRLQPGVASPRRRLIPTTEEVITMMTGKLAMVMPEAKESEAAHWLAWNGQEIIDPWPTPMWDEARLRRRHISCAIILL
jgi:hypothetical protein